MHSTTKSAYSPTLIGRNVKMPQICYQKLKAMKRLKILTGFICLIMVSCIPSLHPIYTEADRLLDDRIEGLWVNENIKEEAEKLGIALSGMSPEDLENIGIESEANLFGIDEAGYWNFERAADISYQKIDENDNSINIHLEDQLSESHDKKLLSEGYKLVGIDLKPYYILEYSNLEDVDLRKERVKVVLTKIKGELYIDFQTLPEIREASRFSINLIPAHTFAKLEFAGGDMYIRSFDSQYIEKLIKNKRVNLKHELVEETIILTASTSELRAFIEKYGQDEKLYVDREKLIKI